MNAISSWSKGRYHCWIWCTTYARVSYLLMWRYWSVKNSKRNEILWISSPSIIRRFHELSTVKISFFYHQRCLQIGNGMPNSTSISQKVIQILQVSRYFDAIVVIFFTIRAYHFVPNLLHSEIIRNVSLSLRSPHWKLIETSSRIGKHSI